MPCSDSAMQKRPSHNCQSAFIAHVAPSRHRTSCKTIVKKYLCGVELANSLRVADESFRAKLAIEAERHVDESASVFGYLRHQRLICASSLVAGPSDEKGESDDQNSDNQHPVLDVHAKNIVRLNEKLHRVRPFIVQGKPSRAKRILFIYGHTDE